MPKASSWIDSNISQCVQLATSVIGVVLAILDLTINNSAGLTWIAITVWSAFSAEVKVWHALTAIILLIFLTYSGREYFFSDDYGHALGIDWILNGEEDQAEYPIPICPECGMELDIDSKVVGTFEPYTPGVRSHGNIVYAKTTCDRCGFEKEWTEITDKVVSTLSGDETPDLDKQIRNEAMKRIRSERRGQWRFMHLLSRD